MDFTDPVLIGIVGILVLFILLAAGVHIALALGIVGMVGTIAITGFNAALVLYTARFFYSIADFGFIAIPLFIFMGTLAGTSGLGQRLYQSAHLWLNRVPGGLGVATVGSCAAFGVVTGSSLVCASVFAKISAPEMRRFGFDKSMAYGICASGGVIGMLIPPSLLMVTFGIISELSIGRLLIAGISPGIILTLLFSIGIVVISHFRPSSTGSGAEPVFATWRQRFYSLIPLWPFLVVGIIVIGGLFGGVFGPSEAAAVGAVALTVITLIILGLDNGWKMVNKAVRETVPIAAMVFMILACAAIFGRFLVLSRITPTVLDFVIQLGLSKLAFLIAVAMVYLVMGCFLDAISIQSITLPTIMPIIYALNIEPMWFAMVACMAIEIGLITPPVGLNIFAVQAVAEADVSLEDIVRGIFPFFLMMCAAEVLLIAIPWLSTFLPNVMLD
ncbi:TRAP transporter large permease [Chloroflexota bacterium]